MFLDSYVPMQKIIPPGISGNCKIEHFTITKEDAEFSRMRAIVSRDRDAEVTPGEHTRLIESNKTESIILMSDTDMERRTNIDFLINANGNVLVAGLGLGMILVPVLQNVKTISIEVIEKSQDVINLVEQPLRAYLASESNKKLSIIKADIFQWKLPKSKKWDCVYFDIWNDICTDNLGEITKLKRKFARRLNRENPDAWMGAWQEENLRYWKRMGR
jgi:hypothetical protein